MDREPRMEALSVTCSRDSKEVRECEYQRKGIPGRRSSQCKFLEKAAVQ